MKSSILILVLGVIATVESDPEWHIDILIPKGFRLLMKDDTTIQSASISGDIGDTPYKVESTENAYSGNMTKRSDGWWIYQNNTTPLNPGDKTIFAIVRKGPVEDDLENVLIDQYTVPEDAVRVAP